MLKIENKISRDIRKASSAMAFTPEVFQRPFMQSTCRFPAFIGAWGTGKTLCGIMKGIMLSLMYPGNSGIIIRKTFKSLSRSTIKDFENWTGLKVGEQKSEVEIPESGGSTIAFAHAENLQDFRFTIQGMNIGWAEIEQCDELDSAEVFNELDGRIRRILTPNMSIQNAMIRAGIIKEIIPDFARLGQEQRDDIEDAIISKLRLPVRQLMVTGNANGHNWAWRRWKKPDKTRDKEYQLFEATSEQNRKNVPRSTLRSWDNMKLTAPKRHARMVMNSWEDYDIEGAYYAGLISDALKEGRTELTTLYDANVPVYTFWDLGIRASDSTSIWFVQFIGDEIWLIDYLEDYGKGMAHYSKELSRKPYEYAAHYLPPDSVQRLQGEEITVRLDIMRKLRREPVRVVPRHRVEERIACVRGLLNRCKFNANTERGVDCLNNYRKKKYELQSSEDNPVFMSKPADDEWTNGADSFGYMAMVYRYEPPRNDDAYNYFSGDGEGLETEMDDVGNKDMLSVK
jgi:hypothetical protein